MHIEHFNFGRIEIIEMCEMYEIHAPCSSINSTLRQISFCHHDMVMASLHVHQIMLKHNKLCYCLEEDVIPRDIWTIISAFHVLSAF